MSPLPHPPKPLRILTIDGGGLQGISTLIILKELLYSIAHQEGPSARTPRPCDVFDVIAGIGTGGWLALLLGRFMVDVPAALAEWYNLIDCITPQSEREEFRMRLMHRNSYVNTKRLVERIDELAEFYETDENLYVTPPEDVRCKHVLVAAMKTDPRETESGYSLYRTYDCPEGSKLLDGPPDPQKYKISHAFAATGATKYFTPPWKESSLKGDTIKYQDIQFPSPHNITKLALDEVWGLYGTDVEISVVVNIGPGIPCASDCRIIPRRLSWYKTFAITDTHHSEKDDGIEEELRGEVHKIDEEVKKKLRDVYEKRNPPYYRLGPGTSAPGAAQNGNHTCKASADLAEQYLQSEQGQTDMREVARRIFIEFEDCIAPGTTI